MKTRSNRHCAGVRYACEAFERRILLTTFTINGSNAADTWHLVADAGSVTVNGVTTTNPSITDVQVNGLDGNNDLFVDHSTIPVVFNGGNNNDRIFVAGVTAQMSQDVTATLTFNGGGGADLADCRNDNYLPNNSYSYSGNSFSWGTGNLVWNSGVEELYMTAGPGDSSISVGSLASTVNITVNGNTGSDSMSVNMAGGAGTVGFVGGNGAGTDSLAVNDASIVGPITYTIGTGTVSRSGRTVNHAGVESLSLTGVSASSGTYNISGANASTAIAVTGGNAADTFNVTASQDANLTITGGGGSVDSMVVDDRTNAQNIPQADIGATYFTRYFGPTAGSSQTYSLSYSGIEAWIYYGKNSTNYVNVFGTPSSIASGQQATIVCGTGNDTVSVFPHDGDGNLTINGLLGVFGGGGTDLFRVDDSASSSPINYTFSNISGASTTNIAGLGAANLGVFNDFEMISIVAGDGADTFTMTTWQSGTGLAIDSDGGLDEFDLTPGTHDIKTGITSMSSFNYDGGPAGNDGDHFDIFNDNSAVGWTITRTATQIQYVTSGYSLTLGVTNLGYLFASGGIQPDSYLIKSTPAAEMNNDLYGAGGNDTYTFGNAGLTSGIASYCNVNGFGGNDSIVIDDSADTTGRSFHVNSGFINAVPGDTLFPAAGGDIYGIVVPSSVTGTITIKLGSGADTINFAPVNTGEGTYSLQANNPTTGAGDTLNLAFAAVTGTVFTPGVTGAGSYTFTNRAGFSYSGIETKNPDPVAPTFLGGKYNYDPVNGSSLDLQYSEDVSPGLYNTHFDLYDQTTNTSIAFGDWTYSYDSASNTVHYTFPGLPGGVLPDGSYLTSSSRITDAAGNALVGPVDFNFIWSGGTAAADAFRVALDVSTPGNVDVFENDNTTPAFTAPLATLGQIFLAGGEDDDSLVADVSGGNPIPSGGLTFDGGNAGSDSLDMIGSAANDNLTVNPTSVSLNGASVKLTDVENRSLNGNGGADTLNNQTGTLNLIGPQHFASLTIKSGGLVVAQPGGGNTLVIDAMTLVGTGSLDASDNSLIFTHATLAAVQAWITTGFNGGLWNGSGGIRSSSAAADPNGLTALGYLDNADLQATEFAGVSGLNGTEILVKYTYYGDADLSGNVTLDDFSQFLNGYQTQSAATNNWLNGDFDFSGNVTLDDFSQFLYGYQSQGASL